MSELIDALRTHGVQQKGTPLGGILQWAALHIESQDDALADLHEEHAAEEAERLRLERALHDTTAGIEAALAVARLALRPPIDLGRDFVPHINLMGAYGDPDYVKANGMSIRHTDTRSRKPRKEAT